METTATEKKLETTYFKGFEALLRLNGIFRYNIEK